MHNSGCPDGMRYVIPAHRWRDPVSEFGNLNLQGEAQTLQRSISMDSSRVVDRISCRQMYLRSYTFTTREEEETFQDKARKCLGRLRKSVAYGKLMVLRRAREISHDALLSIYSRLISCTTKIDIAQSVVSARIKLRS